MSTTRENALPLTAGSAGPSEWLICNRRSAHRHGRDISDCVQRRHTGL